MKFLDDIEEMKKIVAAIEAATAKQIETAAALDVKLEEVRQAIANAPAPRTFDIKTSAGQEFVVSERDALLIICAAMVNLDSKEAHVTLNSGQTIALKLTDLEQTAAVILEASRKASP